eukprot:m.176336 g.176336  ORF g.176336 m.176336 type:complete len:282 (-) comp24437_c0_seq2:135-980(-)
MVLMIAYDVLVLYGALVVWACLLTVGFRRRNFWPFLGFGTLIMLALNVGYFVKGPPDAIAFFIGIYDVFDNLGLERTEGAPALAQCVDNACTVWGDRFVYHPSWGVAFHDRFLNGPQHRTNLLYAHIFFNSIAFVLLHFQLWKPGVGADRARHRLVGRVTFGATTIGTFVGIRLASEHGAVSEYGGRLAEFGFYSMSAFVFGTAVMSAVKARTGDLVSHRKWAIRYAGAMWGAFWIFRVMLVVTGPLLRNYESVSLLLSIWLSAPLGILVAESFRKRRISP